MIQHHPARARVRPTRVQVEDRETTFELVFFHARGEYLQKILPVGGRRVVSGKLEMFDSVIQMTHPDHILPLDEAGDLPLFEPVYPLTAGVSQKVMYKATRAALARMPELDEWADAEQLRQAGWSTWAASAQAAHAPTCLADLTATAPARERLAYDEFFAHQLTLALARMNRRKGKGRVSTGDGALRAKVLKSIPFEPTGAQSLAVSEIAKDMAQPARMNRLLQGDVGAGKTLVALMALLVAVEAGGQGVMMAPT